VVRLRLIEQGLLKEMPLTSSPRHAAREAVTNIVSIPVPVTPAPAPAPRPNLKVVAALDNDVVTSDQQYLSTSEFLGATGLSSTSVHHLHALGLLAPVSLGRDIAFTQYDVRVAMCANALIERGLDVRLLGSLRRVAEREVGLVDDLSAPLRSRASGLSGDQAQSVTVDLASEVSALRDVLYERALQEYLGN